MCGVAAQRAVLGGHEAAEQRVAVEEAGEGAGGLGGVVGTPQTEEGLGTHPVAGDTVDGRDGRKEERRKERKKKGEREKEREKEKINEIKERIKTN